MKSRTAHGAINMQPGPHHARNSTLARDSFQLAGRSSLRPVTRSHGLAARNDHASTPRRPFLLQFAIDVAAVLAALLLIAVTGVGLAFSAFAFLFLSF